MSDLLCATNKKPNRTLHDYVCPVCGVKFSSPFKRRRTDRGSMRCSRTCGAISTRVGSIRSVATVEPWGDAAAVRLSVGSPHRIILDTADADWFLDYDRGWCVSVRRDSRAYVRIRGGGEYLHRILLPGASLVDHINGDGLDNRRGNLRPATPGQNASNHGYQLASSSRFIGIHLHAETGKWTSVVTFGRRRWYVGLFASEERCAMARDAVASLLHGDFARLNFPDRLAQSQAIASARLAQIREALRD